MVSGRKSGATGRRSGKILGSRHEERPCGESSYIGGGNLRQEAWSVRRSHPTVFHREATLIADVEATMDVGHDDRRGTHRWRAERCRLRSIRQIFIFLTLSHHPPRPLIPFSRPFIPIWTHFFPHIRFPVGTEPHSSSSISSSHFFYRNKDR